MATRHYAIRRHGTTLRMRSSETAGHALRPRFGLALIELLVVLFIISVMISLLFPAVQATRAKMRATVCQNNVRQIGVALRGYIYALKKFPDRGLWSVDILRWMEEWPLAEEAAGGVPKNAVLPRPPLFRCPAQPDVQSSVPNVLACHYVLTVDRPRQRTRGDKIPWDLLDRPRFVEDNQYEPWYIGPEITFAQQKLMFTMQRGPHPAGEFYSQAGQVYRPAN